MSSRDVSELTGETTEFVAETELTALLADSASAPNPRPPNAGRTTVPPTEHVSTTTQAKYRAVISLLASAGLVLGKEEDSGDCGFHTAETQLRSFGVLGAEQNSCRVFCSNYYLDSDTEDNYRLLYSADCDGVLPESRDEYSHNVLATFAQYIAKEVTEIPLWFSEVERLALCDGLGLTYHTVSVSDDLRSLRVASIGTGDKHVWEALIGNHLMGVFRKCPITVFLTPTRALRFP